MHLIVYRILWCKAEILQELGEEGHPYMGKAVGFVSRISAALCCRDKFDDEIRDNLKHTGAGILSMANRLVMYSWFISVILPSLLRLLHCVLLAPFPQWTKHKWKPVLFYSCSNQLARW